MAYNNGFPMSYQQFYQPQYQSPYGGFQNNQPLSPTQMSATNQQAQMMTPPTIHAEIVQIADRNEAVNYPVGAGQAQMMITRDDSTIFVKSAFANGQSSLTEYVKKAPEPQKPVDDFITREEFERRLAELHRSAEKKVNDEPNV
jgi:hypothetical protein